MGDPGTLLEVSGDLRDRAVRHAEKDELAAPGHGDPTLAQPSGNGRPDAAGTDDLDCVEHESSSSVADTGQMEAYTGADTLASLVGRRLLLALFVAAALAMPGQAGATIPLASCGRTTQGLECRTG